MSPDTPKYFGVREGLLQLVLEPDPRLHKVCKRVKIDEFGTPELITQVGRMTEVMYAYQGIGVAANQVGFDNRVIVVAKNPECFPNTSPLTLINPVIQTRSNKKQTIREGCLSFPSKTIMRRRSVSIRLIAYDLSGNKFSWQARGLAAQCIQHEVDHLNGKTMFDIK